MTKANHIPRPGKRKAWLLIVIGVGVVLLVAGVIVMANSPMNLAGHAEEVRAVAFSPDGATLASGSQDTTIKLWDVKTGKELATLEPPEGRYLGPDRSRGTVYDPINGKRPPFIFSLVFSPDGKMLATGALDDSLRLWDVSAKKQTLKIQLEPSGPFGRGNNVFGVAFSPDGKAVATATADKLVRLWSVETGKMVRELKGHTGFVYAVAFSSDGKTLASSSADKTVRLWDVAEGQELRTLVGHTELIWSVAFTPDGKTLASAAGNVFKNPPAGELKLWDVATGKELAALKGHKGEASSVAFSPDGKYLASGGGSSTGWFGEVLLWDVEKRELITRRTDHSKIVFSVAFSPDGKKLASGSGDKTVKVWDVGQLVKP